MSLFGIDVSGHQPPTVTSTVKDYEFALVKVSGGTEYVSGKASQQIDGVIKRGKLLGLYHFALDGFPDKGPVAEADHFLRQVEPYLKLNPILVLDWEAEALKLPLSWAHAWLDRVYEKTGVKALFYTYADYAQRTYSLSSIAQKGHELWVASYGNEGLTPRTSYHHAPEPPKDLVWSKAVLFQFTRAGVLNGYTASPGFSGKLDLNVFYGDRKTWETLAKDHRKAPNEPIVTPPKPNPTPTPQPPRKTGQVLAQEVLDGKWGNGADRKNNLEKAGYNYQAVQNEVNLVLTRRNADKLAREVIDGKWGDGADRVKRLKDAGWDPTTIQNEVNKLLNQKSLSEIAKEVIQGKWGNGNVRMARLRIAGYDAAAVQKEVNRQLNSK